MSTHNAGEIPDGEPVGSFQTTHWSVILAAGHPEAPRAEAALESLCRLYWPPLYAYVRRQGHTPHDAQDLTQEFFARLLEKRYIQLAERERGRFRSYLLKSLQHFLVNEWVRGQALKRGGGRRHIPMDADVIEQTYQQVPATQWTPEVLFERQWARTLLDRATHRLGMDYAAAGKSELFGRLKNLLLTESTTETYRQLAEPLGLSEGAVKVAVHRLRQRFRGAVREEVARTVATPADIDEELRCLMAAMSA